MTKDTLILAHYYTIPEVQEMADYVGDSLDLALHAVREKPKRIVFAGVKFMAETAKILNPNTEVILPDAGSTCSLVEQTDMHALYEWVARARVYFRDKEGKEVIHVSYINSSAEHKTHSDVIVTSRIADDVIKLLHEQDKKVIFSPDRNMGAYLNLTYGYKMPIWSAVCEVHDKFKAEELDLILRKWTDGPKYVLAHPESPLPVLLRADYVGSTHGMLKWVKEYSGETGTIFVATEEGLLYNMRNARPELDIQQAPTYTGCACAVCPFMKKNTVERVENAIKKVGSNYLEIDYMSDDLMDRARVPIERMLKFTETGNLPI